MAISRKNQDKHNKNLNPPGKKTAHSNIQISRSPISMHFISAYMNKESYKEFFSSIKFRIDLMIFIIGLFGVIISFVSFNTTNHLIGATKTIYLDRVQPLSTLNQINNLYSINIMASLYKVKTIENEQEIAVKLREINEIVSDARKNITDLYREYLATYLIPEEVLISSDAEKLMKETDVLLDKTQDLLNSSKAYWDIDELTRFTSVELLGSIEKINKKISALVRIQEEEAGRVFKEQQEDGALLAKVLAASTVLVLLLALLTSVVLSRWVTQPLSRLVEVMLQVASDSLNVVIPCLRNRDELGTVARAVEVFQKKARERLALEASRDADMAERSKLLSGLADRVEGEVGGTALTMNDTVRTMKDTTQSVAARQALSTSRTAAVGNAAGDMVLSMDILDSTVDQMSSTIQEIAHRAAGSSTISQAAAFAVDEATDQISRLVEAAEQIGNIVDLINSIAGQTNLLALNATIEAARAGDAGRGFAIVAAEVKGLATQTASATDDIAKRISDIQAETTAVAQRFRVLRQTIDEVDEASSSIAAAVEEQNAAMAEISRCMQAVHNSTQTVSREIQDVSHQLVLTGAGSIRTLWSLDDLQEISAGLEMAISGFAGSIRGQGDTGHGQSNQAA